MKSVLSEISSGKDLLRKCCVCDKIYWDSKWIDENHPMYGKLRLDYGKEITHGYCTDCVTIELEKIRTRKLRELQTISL